jgi:hypothetical protein
MGRHAGAGFQFFLRWLGGDPIKNVVSSFRLLRYFILGAYLDFILT